MTIKPRDTKSKHMASICPYHRKDTTNEWIKNITWGLVTNGIHVSNLKPKLGLRELTMGKNSIINR